MFVLFLFLAVSESPPTNFIQQPTAGSPELQGNTKVLLCEASGLPVPVYRWKKDKKFMTQTNITDTSIKIMNIRRSDAGEYQSLASNTQGAILSNRVFLKVACKYTYLSSVLLLLLLLLLILFLLS